MPPATCKNATRLDAPEQNAIDLERYVPALLTWTANKLSSGASQVYLEQFGVGIETWRCISLLATKEKVTAQQVCQIMGMDKSAVSRCFKSMQQQGLMALTLSESDGRLRLASLTSKGQRIHDQILGVALERERALLAPLSAGEREAFRGLLRRIHDNLPEVERATHLYLQESRSRTTRAGTSK